jgi:hypothetical protein
MSGLRDMSRRQDSYKNKGQFKSDELRRRREEAQVEIRKQKRDESMAKRRNLNAVPDASGGETDDEELLAGASDAQVSRSRERGMCTAHRAVEHAVHGACGWARAAQS